MISIEERIAKYEQDLNNTLKGYEAALAASTNPKEIEQYKKHIEKIKHIKNVGVQNYNGLSNLTSVNYFAANYKSMEPGLFDTYTKSFGIEKNDEYYNMLKSESDPELVRNTIWQDCYGMSYPLMTRAEAKMKYDEATTPEERVAIICSSGYDNNPNPNSYTNPTHLPPELLEAAIKKINTNEQTYK